jgi:hypothetical protein
MFQRLRRGLIASVLALAVTLPGTAQPVQAFNPAVIKQYIDLATAAYNLVKSVFGGGGSEAAIRDAVRQIVAAVEASKVEILSHVDAIATADARACAAHHVIEFVDIEQFNPTTLQLWAQDVTGCVTRIDSLLSVVTDQAQLDLLGLALNVAGPIALAARSKAGFSTAALTSTLLHANQSIQARLVPTCRTIRDSEGAVEFLCTNYDGTQAISYPWISSVNLATKGTSRTVARTVIPLLS